MKDKSRKVKRGKPTTSADGAPTSQGEQETLCLTASTFKHWDDNPRHRGGSPEVDNAVDLSLAIIERIEDTMAEIERELTPGQVMAAYAVLSNSPIIEALGFHDRYMVAFAARFLADQISCQASCYNHDIDGLGNVSEMAQLVNDLHRRSTE